MFHKMSHRAGFSRILTKHCINMSGKQGVDPNSDRGVKAGVGKEAGMYCKGHTTNKLVEIYK